MERRGKKERKKGEGARQKGDEGKMREGGSEKGKTEKKGKKRGAREGNGGRRPFDPLVHSPKVHDGLDWEEPKPGAWNSVQFLYVGGRSSLEHWSHCRCLSGSALAGSWSRVEAGVYL